MKIKEILSIVVILTIAMGAKAQTGVVTGTPFGSGEDSLRCRQNISLTQTNIDTKNYADALPLWKMAYEECPGSYRNLYTWGEQIIKWQIQQAKDEAEAEGYFNDLMDLFDKRIKYFGNDAQYDTNWIMSRKANEYLAIKGDKADVTVVYNWLKPMLEQYKEKTHPLSLSLYMMASQNLMASDVDKYMSQFVDDFLTVSALYDAKLEAAKATNDETAINTTMALKAQLETAFTQSGAADCEIMEKVYADKIEAQQTDLDFLKTTMILFNRVGCNETEAYFAAANYAHKIEPTAESAMGIAYQAIKKKDNATAEKYFLEAVEMTSDNTLKATLNYSVAILASSSNNYQKARMYALRALDANSNHGRALLTIGQTYGATASSVYSNDPVLRKMVYVLAVDKFERARQVDPSIADDAVRLINQYRAQFPTTEEVFMHPDLEEGASFTVGGWINERTTVKVRR